MTFVPQEEDQEPVATLGELLSSHPIVATSPYAISTFLREITEL